MSGSRRAALAVAAVAIVTYGALLRLDALTMKFGPVERPAWLHGVQTRVQTAMPSWRPAGFAWSAEPEYPHADGPPTRYISDPHTYLGFARGMTSFYAAHYREPLFVLATRVWLWLLDDQDVAVSFASVTFSIAAVAVVIALGWYGFSPWVGLGAGALMAIEFELVSWGISGWRDEAFVAVVPLWALALLRTIRMPSPVWAAALGGVGGLALLVRVTSLSFVLPGLLALALAGRQASRQTAGAAAIATLVATAIAAPYFINCWRVFDDPLYAINYHAEYYAAAERRDAPVHSAAAYVGSAAWSRPLTTVDTFAAGLTTYPFSNKWNGFEVWLPGLGRVLAWLALAGLLALAMSPTGWLLIFVLVTSLAPFAVTWQLLADWRFTEHAYAFYLIGACVAVERGVTFIWNAGKAGSPARVPVRSMMTGATLLAGAAVVWWAETRVMPVLVFEEALATGDAAVIESGRRDEAFFAAGWTAPARQGAITVRTADAFPSVLNVPLPEAGDYVLRLRVDPVTSVAGDAGLVLRVFANGQPIGQAPLVFDPERVGDYEFPWPRAATRAGANRVDLLLDVALARTGTNPGGPPAAFRFWYAMVRRAGPG